MKSLKSETDIGKACNVKIDKVMLECHLVLFEHFLSSGLHSRIKVNGNKKVVYWVEKGRRGKEEV